MKLKICMTPRAIRNELEAKEYMDEITMLWDGEFSIVSGPADNMLLMLGDLCNSVNLDDVISDEV